MAVTILDLCSPVITRVSHIRNMRMLRAEGGEGGTDIGAGGVPVHDNVRHHQRRYNFVCDGLGLLHSCAPILGIAYTA